MNPPSKNPAKTDNDSDLFLLSEAKEGDELTVHCLKAGKCLDSRVRSVGLTLNSKIKVVQKRGGAIIIDNSGSRLMFGAGIANKVMVKKVG